jgi:hypothetical protein
LCGLVKAPGKSAPDCVAQFSTAPRGRCLLSLPVAGHAETAGSNPIAVTASITLAIAETRRCLIVRKCYTGAPQPASAARPVAATVTRPSCLHQRTVAQPSGRRDRRDDSVTLS